MNRAPTSSLSASGRDESRRYISDGGHLLPLLPTAGEKCGLANKRVPTFSPASPGQPDGAYASGGLAARGESPSSQKMVQSPIFVI